MSDTAQQTAAAANRAVYDSGWTEVFVEGAPHLKHADLRAKFDALLAHVLERATVDNSPPRVLDLGAGEGSVTRRLLERGAVVTAVDVSDSQLAELARKCSSWNERLTVRPGEVDAVLSSLEGPYDVIVASAFLHHVPDYLGLVRRATELLAPHGQFLSFQDPLRYDTISRLTRLFGGVSYLSWRIFQGDLWGGTLRRLRRTGGQLDDSALDQAEYHILRNGVDQDSLAATLRAAGFECEVIRYFSTQSRVCQQLGTALGLEDTFGVIACR
jgi:cyclopropane fatty-acyl-phospholipid synthase-like methyltransferase